MESVLEKALFLRFPPLAIYYAQEPPVEAKLSNLQCSMLLVAQAAKGATVVVSKDTCKCEGGPHGFGLEDLNPDDNPGGRECFLRFLSTGNKDWEQGRAVIEEMKSIGLPKLLIEEFAEGEGFLKTPELVAEWAENTPKIKPEGPYVVIKPLKNLKPGEQPKAVAFLVDPDQLSALVVLANFARPGTDHVRIPMGSGCSLFGLHPFYEGEQETPHAIVGLTDISARFYLHKILGRDIMSFTAPWSFYEEMESNVSESFLTRFAWKTIMNK